MSTRGRPLVHLNGTSRDALLESYKDPANALRTALRELERNGPNARDYYPLGPDAFPAAVAEHVHRMRRVADVIGELEALMEHVHSAGR